MTCDCRYGPCERHPDHVYQVIEVGERPRELGVPHPDLDLMRRVALAIHRRLPQCTLELEVQVFGRRVGTVPIAFSDGEPLIRLGGA